MSKKKRGGLVKFQAEDEESLFLASMADVSRLSQKEEPVQVRKKPRGLKAKTTSREPGSPEPEKKEWGPLSTIQYGKPGVSRKLLKRLKRGQLDVEDSLDLHGMRWNEAQQEILSFLEEWSVRDACVLIVHGKGHGATVGRTPIKSNLYNLLPTLPCVLAASTALPQDGGLGAVYILTSSEKDN
ncbi:MAG: hypothetical protein EP343_10650 [Deltaproteobacteria bacterium]|nr:MAG: hypothetical protein EP343_10650 [Deltaproteobacteria bacterium]